MLSKVDLSASLDDQEYKNLTEPLFKKLTVLQQELIKNQIPVVVLLEGWGASGKGSLLNRIILSMDPRGFTVHPNVMPTREEEMRPFLYKYGTRLPANGRMALFIGSWYRRVMDDYMDHGPNQPSVMEAYKDIVNFEQQLTDSGVVLIKFFLHISKAEQAKRLDVLSQSENTKWRVTPDDWKHNTQYNRYSEGYNHMLKNTSRPTQQWMVVSATDTNHAAYVMLKTMIESFNKRLKQDASQPKIDPGIDGNPKWLMRGLEVKRSLSKIEYSKKLDDCQSVLRDLHNRIYLKRVPVIVVLEGQDASGKGGAIKRLCEPLDPRGYEVVPVGAPSDDEKKRHYMWRFWNHIPKAGHITIFDRSWYGRVLVERVEGFCTQDEWQRAYDEINNFERHLHNFGCVIVKLYMNIHKDEQEERFNERLEDPTKKWKITEEDWRNRNKWDSYVVSAEEMIKKTATKYAPWTVVEANSKRYARIKVIETIIEKVKERL